MNTSSLLEACCSILDAVHSVPSRGRPPRAIYLHSAVFALCSRGRMLNPRVAFQRLGPAGCDADYAVSSFSDATAATHGASLRVTEALCTPIKTQTILRIGRLPSPHSSAVLCSCKDEFQSQSSRGIPHVQSRLLLATPRISRFSCLVRVPAMGWGQANVQGKWSTLSNTMPINLIHVVLLNSGKLLVVAGSGNCPPAQSGCPSGPPYGPPNGSGALLMDPLTGQTLSQFTLSWDMFGMDGCWPMAVRFLPAAPFSTTHFMGSPRRQSSIRRLIRSAMRRTWRMDAGTPRRCLWETVASWSSRGSTRPAGQTRRWSITLPARDGVRSTRPPGLRSLSASAPAAERKGLLLRLPDHFKTIRPSDEYVEHQCSHHQLQRNPDLRHVRPGFADPGEQL